MVNYCAMRMIGDDKPDVILGGDGSDQYFGTSGREVALHYLSARIGLRPLLRGISRLLEHETFDTGGKLSRINFHLDKILHILEGERFGFSDSALCALLQNPKEDFEPVKITTARYPQFRASLCAACHSFRFGDCNQPYHSFQGFQHGTHVR